MPTDYPRIDNESDEREYYSQICRYYYSVAKNPIHFFSPYSILVPQVASKNRIFFSIRLLASCTESDLADDNDYIYVNEALYIYGRRSLMRCSSIVDNKTKL